MKPYKVLSFETEELQRKIKQISDLSDEIKELGKMANEQGSETFGHDNPILEAKHEKERMLSLRLPEMRKIEAQLKQCLVVDSNDNGSSIGLGSIVTFQVNNLPINKVLITGVTQGKKVLFKGGNYITICPNSPIWDGFFNKKVGDETKIKIGGSERNIKIIEIEN